MNTVLITGGTGLIGRAITRALLAKNYAVIILSRGTGNRQPRLNNSVGQAATGNLSYAAWDIKDQTIDKEAIAKADYIIHLAGAGVADKRWTQKRKKEIVDSRVKGGELIVRTLKEEKNNVKAIISSSGIGWYGPDPRQIRYLSDESPDNYRDGPATIPNPRPFMEDDPAAEDFLGKTCEQWEKSLEPVTGLGKRLVVFRTGIVLSNDGGALKEFKKPVRFGIAAILGNGKQIISWIHIDDLVRMYIEVIEHENIKGVYNAVAPDPISNKRFTIQLARMKKGRFFIPVYVPSFVLKMILGEMSLEVLKSATVSCKKIVDTGFSFSYQTIDAALNDLK